VADVLIYQINDDGEIEYREGRVSIDEDGLASAAFLSLFGGNEDDSGLTEDDPREWWANKIETDDAQKYRSQFQHLVQALPAISANLRRLEDAAAADLAWMTESLVDSVTVAVSIPKLNRVKTEITFEVRNKIFKVAFEAPWGN